MKNQLKLALLALSAAAMVGCTAPNALSTQTDANNEVSIRTITNNPVLTTEVFVERVGMSMAGDLKKASIAIKNRRFNNKDFSYKIVWIDAHGAEVNPEGAIWKPIQLTGREVKGVQSLAPNPSAVDVVVYLKK